MIETVLDFFIIGKLLKVMNVTTLTLVPKVECPGTVSYFRPIAWCTILYKCMTKLISEKLNGVLHDIVSASQGAFVASRSILNNVMICQDLIKAYNRKSVRACSMMKWDLRKAYDTVN